MTIHELANILSKMYEEGEERKEKSVMIHLFGIKYAEIMKKNGYTPKEIIKNTKLSNGSAIPESYQVEINKGINLAKYVMEKV